MDLKKTLLYLHYNNNLKRFWKCVLQYTVPDRWAQSWERS